MTTTGWIVVGVGLAVTLAVCAALAVFAWKLLARYVDWVFQAPKWIVVVGFILFPPAFIAFLVGLIPYSRWVEKSDKAFVAGVMEEYWAQHPPSDRLTGDEKTRREVTLQRRKLGYPD